MRFKILAAAVMVSTVGVSAATVAGAATVAAGHRHHTAKQSASPATAVAQNSQFSMPLPLRPASERPKPFVATLTKPKAAPGGGGGGGGGGGAAVGSGGRADRSGGRAASF
jgi:hypothetical protein